MQITVLKSTVDSALPTITRIMYDKDAVNPLFYKFTVKLWDGCDNEWKKRIFLRLRVLAGGVCECS